MQQFFHQHGSEILSKGFEHLYISDCDWLNQCLADNPFSCFIGIDDPAIWRR